MRLVRVVVSVWWAGSDKCVEGWRLTWCWEIRLLLARTVHNERHGREVRLPAEEFNLEDHAKSLIRTSTSPKIRRK